MYLPQDSHGLPELVVPEIPEVDAVQVGGSLAVELDALDDGVGALGVGQGAVHGHAVDGLGQTCRNILIVFQPMVSDPSSFIFLKMHQMSKRIFSVVSSEN